MSRKIDIKYLSIFLSIFIFVVRGEDIKEISLNEKKKGSLKNDEYDFYKFVLPGEIDKDNQLVFELEPNPTLDSINNIVSDPNLYISKNDIHPTNLNHQWSSNRFGDETISISGPYLDPFQIFYIGIHCKQKCNYILEISLIKNILLQENKINSYTIEKDTVMKFSFTTRNEFKELTLNIIGSFLNSFYVYLAKNNPSSSNTLPSEPILFNGYEFIIKNDDSGNNNKNVKYDLVVDNREVKQDLSVWLKYDNDNIKIKEAEILYDAISANKANCYYYSINKINQNKDIILSTTLFNGLGFIYISGFNAIDAGTINQSFKNKENSYKIIQNKAIHLTKSEFENYGQYDNNKEKFLNFCFYAEKNTSLSIKIHLLENFKNIQTLNYIYPGIKTEDILPPKSLTRYKIEHFNIENDINIFLTKRTGNAILYLYMMSPDRTNDLLDYDNFQPLKKSQLVLEGQEYFIGYHLLITKQLNKCTLGKFTNKYSCYLNAVIECTSNEECSYELFFDHSKFNILMTPKQIYKNAISENEADPYTIVIDDPSTKNLAIVLTPNTGKTILKFDYFINNNGVFQNDNRNISKEFMPGLIKFSHKLFNLENLEGNFYFTVEGLSYASYSIYYYTFDDDENEEYLDQDKVCMKLETGNIIKDIFMDNHRFKVYMYDSSNNRNKSDLLITLIETDSINSELYVFKDLNDFSIIDDRIYGYLWKGEYKDYIYINKNEKKYIENDILYIMIYKKTKSLSGGYTNFYLGITDENTPFFLNEGIEFKHQFDRKHTSQKFYYYYINDEEDLQISLSLYIGKIDVIVKVDDIVYTTVNVIDDGYLISIKKNTIDTLCKNKSRCPINIEISNNKDYYYFSSFLIAVKSSKNVPIYLKQGVVNKRSILSGEEQNFIIDLKPDKSFGAKISAFFSSGQGELYARKVLKSELYNITNFPDENNYEYISTYKLSKKNFYIIEIPYDEIANYNPCKILLTIKGIFPGYFSGTKIEYSLSVSNTINELVTDKNYRLFISQGEIVHYHFKVGQNKKRLYISMTNKDKDANMFLNYENYLTSISNYQWKNIGSYNEYLDISLDDSFFTQKQMQDIDGDYYLAIQGLNDCFFNLYISTQDVKIMTLAKGMPAGCACEIENDFCYFRYENINDPTSKIIDEQNIIFYTEYTYGSGSLFGKLYPNGNMEEIINSLPSPSNNDFIGNDLDEYLYIGLNRALNKYTLSSVLVVGVQCKQKSLFDISAALLDRTADLTRNDQNFIYLKLNQDNIYYISKATGKSNKFVFYISQDGDFNFQIKGIIGQAQVHVYTNESLIYNKDLETDEKVTNKNYHHISDFIIDSSKEGDKIYYGSVPKEYGKRNYIFIDIKPVDICLININIHFDFDMASIPLNKEVVANINRYNYYAYFDFLKDMEEVIITVTTLDKSKKYKVYLRRNILEFGDDFEISNQTKYSIPNSLNYDIKGETNSLTSAVALRIQNGPKNIREKSIVRVLVNIESEKYSFNEKLKILVTPLINNINRIKPQPKIYYFSGTENKYTDKTLFILKNLDKENDLMVIEISLCKGDFWYNLVDSPPADTESYSQLQKRSIKSYIYSSNGKKIIIVKNIEVKEYYLMIYGKKEKKINFEGRDEIDNLELLFLYYTTNTKKYNYLITKDSLDYKSTDDYESINFILPDLKKRDTFGKEKYADYMNYTLIVSEKKMDFEYMESTCYLTKLIQRKEKNNEYSYLKTKFDSKNNILNVKGFLDGKTYYINILAKNEYTGEVITYKPIMVVTSQNTNKLKLIVIIILAVVFLIFVYGTFNIYRKYRIQKAKIANFEMNNNGSDNIFKKKIGNLKNINLNFVKRKYNSLSEDNKEINT